MSQPDKPISKSRIRGSDNTEQEVTFRLCYKRGMLSLALLGTLVFIALFVRDDFIRPFIGDMLVVVWLYYTISCLYCVNPSKLARLVIVIAFSVEVSQYLQILSWFSCENNILLRMIFGATFDWLDIITYLVGAIICVFLEKNVTF